MGIISVKVHNYKIHKDLELKPNSQSFVLLGDSGVGKSTVMELLQACFGRASFSGDPLSEGEDEGSAEVVYEHNDGQIFTIKRRFNKRGTIKRFEVYKEDGSAFASLEAFIQQIFGSKFKNAYFDHHEYFNKCNSTQARIEYLVKAMGGDEVADNITKTKELIKERNTLGTQKKTQLALYTEDYPLDADTVEAEFHYYENTVRENSSANETREVYLRANLIDIASLKIEYDLVADIVKKRKDWNQSLDDKKIEKDEALESIKKLQERIKEIDSEVKVVKATLKELDPKAEKELARLESEITDADLKNEEHQIAAIAVMNETIADIIDFNNKKIKFKAALSAYTEWSRLDAEWNKTNDEIKSLKEKNKELFTNAIPIPELTLDIKEVEGKNGDITLLEVPMYNGREFCYPHISEGESLEITAKIQKTLNPDGENFIIIPEAQSMGSRIDGIMERCKEFGVQAIVEFTKRDEKFKVIVTDDVKSLG